MKTPKVSVYEFCKAWSISYSVTEVGHLLDMSVSNVRNRERQYRDCQIRLPELPLHINGARPRRPHKITGPMVSRLNDYLLYAGANLDSLRELEGIVEAE